MIKTGGMIELLVITVGTVYTYIFYGRIEVWICHNSRHAQHVSDRGHHKENKYRHTDKFPLRLISFSVISLSKID